MRTGLKVVSPELAKEYLKANRKNRPVRKHLVDWIAEQIERGEWRVSHQGIAFDKNGDLIDGQHRLMAIAKAGVPVEIVVSTGVDPAAFQVIDCGQRRTTADLTGLDKRVADPLRLAAMINRPNRKGRPTASEVLEIADTSIGNNLKKLVEHCGATKTYFSSAGIKLSAATILTEGVDFDYVAGQYRAFLTGDVLKMSPISRSLYKQVAQRYVEVFRGGAYPHIARGLKVFDPLFCQNTVLKVTTSEIEKAPFRIIDSIRKAQP